MSVLGLTKTTLSAVITATQTRFAVGSSTGMTAGTVTTQPTVLIVDEEAMLVQGVPLAGVVEVMRGYEGTEGRAHASGVNVVYGGRDRFDFRNNQYIGLTGTGGTPDGALPSYRLPLGQRVVYGGKVYQMCDFNATVHTGVVVKISNDGLFNAEPWVSGSAHQGAIGICSEQTSSSDTWGYVQLYGPASAMDSAGTSGITSAYVPIVAASVSSPATGMTALIGTTSTPQHYIYGMVIVGDATTNVTSAASHTGVALPVFLNFPYVFLAPTDPGLS